MKTFDKIKITVIIVLVISCLFMGCMLGFMQDKLNIAELKLQDTAHYFSQELTKAGEKYYQQEQVITSQKNAIKAGLIREQELKEQNIKNLESIVKLTEVVKILGITASYDPIVDTVFVTDSNDFLRVPVGFSYSDKYLYLKGRVLQSGVTHDSIIITNNIKLIQGEKKIGWMKKIPVITYHSDNPYIQVTGMQNLVVEQKTPIYNKLWFRVTEALILFGSGLYFGIK
jgi:hypothetical protein